MEERQTVYILKWAFGTGVQQWTVQKSSIIDNTGLLRATSPSGNSYTFYEREYAWTEEEAIALLTRQVAEEKEKAIKSFERRIKKLDVISKQLGTGKFPMSK
jgi:hypothetical protein